MKCVKFVLWYNLKKTTLGIVKGNKTGFREAHYGVVCHVSNRMTYNILILQNMQIMTQHLLDVVQQ